jgi:DNA-binding XRE family transcriptional regulator
MAQKRLAGRLRTHRKKSGLTQKELARVLGYKHGGPMCRHERGGDVPPLVTALAYEAIFRVPVAELFPGIYQTVEQTIETRLANFERALGQRSAKDGDAKDTAQKLQWLWSRRNGIDLRID